MKIIKLSSLKGKAREKLMNRAEYDVKLIAPQVERIVKDVRKNGDKAVLKYEKKFGGGDLKGKMKITREEVKSAYRKIDVKLLGAIERAYKNIRKFHEAQMPKEIFMETEPGVEVGRRVIPVERAGLYVPGGKAVYPSVMLMLGVPAQVAGVEEIVACTPSHNGKLDVASIVAADMCGVKHLFKIGGAHSISAMAYGTKSVPKCDVIAGPGGPYVSAAQREVSDDVRLDFPPGPSEGMVLADKTANAKFVAADVLSEAEHGPDSAGILVTDSMQLAKDVNVEFMKMARKLPEPRKSYVKENTKKRYSAIIVAKNMQEAVDFVNEYSTEHLVISTKNPDRVMKKIKNAGTFCIGKYSPITAGNFMAGPNAILPTGKKARMYSGVSVDTFLKKPTVEKITKEGLASMGRDIIRLCEFEGFPAHGNSIAVRV